MESWQYIYIYVYVGRVNSGNIFDFELCHRISLKLFIIILVKWKCLNMFLYNE